MLGIFFIQQLFPVGWLVCWCQESSRGNNRSRWIGCTNFLPCPHPASKSWALVGPSVLRICNCCIGEPQRCFHRQIPTTRHWENWQNPPSPPLCALRKQFDDINVMLSIKAFLERHWENPKSISRNLQPLKCLTWYMIICWLPLVWVAISGCL